MQGLMQDLKARQAHLQLLPFVAQSKNQKHQSQVERLRIET